MPGNVFLGSDGLQAGKRGRGVHVSHAETALTLADMFIYVVSIQPNITDEQSSVYFIQSAIGTVSDPSRGVV